MTDMHAVYDGQTFVGFISKDAAGFAAFDTEGNRIGEFRSQSEAVRAVLQAPTPPAPKAPNSDAENSLLRAIETLAKESSR